MTDTYLVGGVNSPVRNFLYVQENPLICKKAKGPFIYDEQGRKYLDFISGWGAVILGHSHKKLIKTTKKTVSQGNLYGLSHKNEQRLAELIKDFIPFAKKLRLVNSGTEAAMTAVRIARAATKREKIIMFSGCYHGHSDSFLVKMGSGGATLSLAASEGIIKDTLDKTLVLPYNDIAAVERAFRDNTDIAAVILEPVAGNMGLIPAKRDFISRLRQLCNEHKTILIFDEIMCGFRAATGSASELYSVEPDIILLGKIIGGGSPVGAVAGKKELMELLAPCGPVYQAGTFSGNPLTCSLGIATLMEIKKESTRSHLKRLGSILDRSLKNIPGACFVRQGSMCCLFFLPALPENKEDADKQDKERFARFHRTLREQGILLPPSPYETWFLNASMSEKDIERAAHIIKKAAEDSKNT